MADRLSDLVIGLRVEDNATKQLKQAQDAVSKFSVTVDSKMGDSSKIFESLKSTISNISGILDMSNSKVAKYYNTVQSNLIKVQAAQDRYNDSIQKQQSLLSSIAAKKASLPTDIAEQITGAANARDIRDKIALQSLTGGTSGKLSTEDVRKNLEYATTLTQLIDEYKELDTVTNQAHISQTQFNTSINSAVNATQNLVNAQLNSSKATDDMRTKFDKLSRTIKGMRFTNLLSLLNLMRRVATTAQKFVEQSSSWIENLNLLEVVFGNTNKEAKDFVQMASKNFGLNANDIARYVSTFKQMANAMGQANEVGTQMSQTLALVALDVASLRNVDFDTAISDFTSALAGQVKPVRKYGFDITSTSIDELLKSSGIGGTSSTLTQAEKQLARAILLIRQSRDAWGDLGKTINTFANQQRVLNDQFKTTLRLFGNLLLGTFNADDTLEEASKTAGIATKMLWLLNGALMALNSVLEIIVPSADNFNLGGIATEAESALEALEELDEEMNSNLASFDKFNAMESADSTSTGIADALNALLSSETSKYMSQWSSQLQSINMYAKEISNTILSALLPEYKEWLNSLDETDRAGATLQQWLNETGKDADYLKEKFGDLKSGLLGVVAALGFMISPLKTIIVYIGYLAVDNKKLRDSLIQIALAMNNFMQQAGQALANMLIDIAPIITALAKVLAVIVKIIDELNIMPEVLLGVVAVIAIIKNYKLIEGVGKLITKMKNFSVTITATSKNGAIQFIEMKKQIDATTIAVGALAFALFYVLANKALQQIGEQFGQTAKLIVSALSIIVGALTTAAVAWAVYHTTMSMGTAAIVIGISTAAVAAGIKGVIQSASAISKHADGGFQTGGLFYAGEAGPEWVGRQNNTATILNDRQMDDIMTAAVAEGVVIGNRASGGNAPTSQRPIVLAVDGRELFRIVEDTGRSQGKVLARA